MSLCINPYCQKPENKDTALFCQTCGSELLLDGRYRVIEQLGSGGFGKTYEVLDCSATDFGREDTKSNIKVLKVLSHNHPKYIELFQREAQFLSRFNHSGIPAVEPDSYFVYTPRNNFQPLHCLVMEKIEGLDLKQYLKQRGAPISEKRAIKWLIQVVKILQEIHRHNFFHRDIKPSNIMLRANGQLALIDFGTAREVTETYLSKQSSGQVTGLFSAGYSPLEQLNGQAVPQSDFFALGRTFVFLLTQKHPSDFYDSYVDDLRWRDAATDLSEEFADFLDYMMARLPRQRPQSAEEIMATLTDIYERYHQGEATSGGLGNTGTKSSPEGTQAINPIEKTSLSSPSSSVSSSPSKASISSETPVNSSPVPSQSESSLDPQFIQRCQQTLAELIGPMASLICQRVFQANPHQSEKEFIETLTSRIPDPQQASQFKQKLLS